MSAISYIFLYLGLWRLAKKERDYYILSLIANVGFCIYFIEMKDWASFLLSAGLIPMYIRGLWKLRK